jgi:Ca2+-binding RTX toxin-like protein
MQVNAYRSYLTREDGDWAVGVEATPADLAHSGGQPSVGDFSLDPYAGNYTYNGLPIYTPQEAADNLTRTGVNFTFGNNGALDDGVLTYGFWTSLDQVLGGYYGEINEDGYVLTSDSVALYNGHFAPFTAEQQAMAIQNIGLWDDLIAVTFQQVSDANAADITFGFTQMSSAAGAHTYFPQEEALNYYYNFDTAGRAAGDVWGNIAYQGDFSGANALPGGYGWQAITHELGHSLGLSHTGDYNASDDNDGDGQPDPISYGNDAYFAQDSQQYSIMSYFDGRYTGQAAVDWDTGYFVYTQTPGVHDILAVQEVYGADYTTRSGDTVYGFNSTADRDIFDFTINDTPVLTIWDGGGNDTLDLSGFESDSIIDINEGAFSSAGQNMSAEYLDYFASIGVDTQPELDAFYARNGLGPDGSPVDNIAIAYGAKIENAIGGSGDDVMMGNDLNNTLVGNAGDDILIGGLGKDTLTGGAGADTFVFADTSMDKIRDFHTGVDKIDLSAFEIDSHAIKIAGNNLFADTDGNGTYDFHIVVQGSQVEVGDLLFG